MLLCNWFDVDNPEHLSAWVTVENGGVWPQGFIPQGVRIHEQWVQLLKIKFSDAWISHVMGTPRRWKDFPDSLRDL